MSRNLRDCQSIVDILALTPIQHRSGHFIDSGQPEDRARIRANTHARAHAHEHASSSMGIEKEKAHACDLCNKRFAVPCLLRDHKDSVHNGIRKSQLGNKSSIKKENTVQEPMECKSCTITFKFPSIYIKHYQDKHGTLPPEYVDKENFICDSMWFYLCTYLFRHEQKVQLKIRPMYLLKIQE